MKRVYIYKGFERFWHWMQAILIFILMFTGFEIHGMANYLKVYIGYNNAVMVHNYAAWTFMILIVFAIFWHITTGQWRQYVPTRKNINAQLQYYLFGIFQNAPHPTGKRVLSKLNPLQKVTYFVLKILIIPVMVLSGILYMYFHYPIRGIELDSLHIVAVIHTLGAFLLAIFIIIHLYLITTGRTLGSNTMAMITGWEVMDDEEAKTVVEDAIDSAGRIIKPVGDDEKEHEEVKKVIVDAIHETETKLKDEKLEGQQKMKKKKNNKKNNNNKS